MLQIRKQFRLGVNPDDIPEIEEMLKKLDINIIGRKEYRRKVNDTYTIEKEYYYCSAKESDVNELMTYLDKEFRGIATISF